MEHELEYIDEEALAKPKLPPKRYAAIIAHYSQAIGTNKNPGRFLHAARSIWETGGGNLEDIKAKITMAVRKLGKNISLEWIDKNYERIESITIKPTGLGNMPDKL